MADKYINLLNWRRISENPHMTVSLDFFKKHEKRWVWKDEYATYCSIWMNNSSALRWSDEFLELYKDRIWWDEISRCDDRFTWTEELIGRFFNHLSWEGLSCNESLPWSKYPGMMNGILTINKPIFITFNNSCAYNSF